VEQAVAAPVTISLPEGIAFQAVEPSVHWMQSRCRFGFHEPMLSELLVDYLRRNPAVTFFDIGTRFGYFALLAAAASGGRSQCYAFEMSPEAFPALQANVVANPQFDCIVPVHAAVGDRDEAARPTSYKGTVLEVDDPDATQTAIDYVTLDTFCRERKVSPGIIKIDVDGYEGHVLDGMATTLASDCPVFLELHTSHYLGPYGRTRFGILSSVLDRGLQIYSFGHHRTFRRRPVRKLSAEAIAPYRSEVDADRGGLFLVCQRDVREYWPNLTVKPWRRPKSRPGLASND
jgi:FkbM family methyltransferase